MSTKPHKQKKIIVGNWKMNPTTIKEAKKIFTGIAKTAQTLKSVQAVICPSYIHASFLKDLKLKNVGLGVQNFYSEQKGSYTGEISVDMVIDLKMKYVLVGHSERRKLGETNETINKKVVLALRNTITPIICIGETVRDEEGTYLSVLKEQIQKALATVSRDSLSQIIIAYEPVWAIGAASAMQPRDIHEMTIFIKKTLIEIFRSRDLIEVPILYGGAVDTTNAEGILREGEADGLLVGRQSLDPKAFSEILQIASSL